jgi:hypothetical protein
LFIVLILICLMLAACAGAQNLIGGSQGGAADPTADVGLGPGGEGDSAGSEGGEEGDDMELVPLIPPCQALKDGAWLFGISYEKLTWKGPPTVEITSGGGLAGIQYEYDKIKKLGTLNTDQKAEIKDVNLKIIWPDCRKEPYEAKTEFRPTVTGTCRDDQIEITFVEKWESPYLIIPCEAKKDVCGEDPCNVTLVLPFGYGGGENKFILIVDHSGNVTPNEKKVPFVGPGGSGTKVYRFEVLK